jgi:MFS family permease
VLGTPGPFRRLLAARTLFALGNSADAFLLLLLAARGLAAAEVALLWGVHNGVKMAAAAVGGGWAERRGRRAVLTTGWIVYAVVYAAFALARPLAVLVPVFLVYGVALGLAEPAEKALAAGLVEDGTRGAAFGALHGLTALAALPASAVFGVIWTWVGAPAAFAVGAVLAVAAVTVLRTVDEAGPSDQGRRAVQP